MERGVHRLAALAFLALAASGCLTGPQEASGAPEDGGCQAFAACLFGESGALPVVVHASPGMPFPQAGLAALAGQVALLSGRGLAVTNGTEVAPLPMRSEDGDLQDLIDGPSVRRLDVFVVDTTRMEGDQPTSGLSFPGSPQVFLFPSTMDQRVAEAGLDGEAGGMARATLEAVVLVHEFGHALGLVGCGIPMVAAHGEGPGSCHSANASSLMHAKVARVAQWPEWRPDSPLGPFAWDAHDLADMAAFRDSVRRGP